MTMQGRSNAADLALFIAAMALVVAASNVLVQHPLRFWGLQDHLTWGAFSYPFAFFVTDLSNRRFGPALTRRLVYAGFAVGVALSIALASPRLAVASGSAFLAGQLLDIGLFQTLRARAWWIAPLASSIAGSALDTLLFFSIAFHCGDVPLAGGTVEAWLGLAGIPGACEPLPWRSLALADFGVKALIALATLLPYRLIVRTWAEPAEARSAR